MDLLLALLSIMGLCLAFFVTGYFVGYDEGKRKG